MADKSKQRVRWVVLVLSCVLMIGNYYCFDNPAALKSQLQQRFNKYPKQRFEFLFVRAVARFELNGRRSNGALCVW
jgi:hypothetical protein